MADSVSRSGRFAVAGFLAVFAVFWSAITLAFDVHIARGITNQLRARSFATADGVVDSSRVEEHSDTDGTTYTPRVRYSYQVAGQSYTSDRYRFGMAGSGDGFAARVVADHPPGRRVEVHYNPREPGEAVLAVGVEGLDLFLVLFMTPFNVVMGALWLGSAAGLARRDSPDCPGGMRIEESMGVTRVRVRRWAGLVAGGATAGAVSFVLVFVVGFTAGFHPSMELAAGALAMTLIGSVVVGLRSARASASGRYDLVIDPLEKSLTLPATEGRREPSRIPLASLHACRLERDAHSSDDSVTYSYHPAVRTGPDGSTFQRVTAFPSEHDAREFLAWFAGRLGVPIDPDSFVPTPPAAA